MKRLASSGDTLDRTVAILQMWSAPIIVCYTGNVVPERNWRHAGHKIAMHEWWS